MDGKGHARIARKVLIVESAVGLSFMVYGEPWAGVGLALGGVGGLLVTPDADHHVKTHEEDRWDGVPVLGPYLQSVWAGYGSKYDHRGRSHWHVYGTITRVFYFGRRFMADTLFWAWVVGVVLLGQVMDGELAAQLIQYIPGGGFLAMVFTGWCIQDSVHIETDRLWSWWRSKKGKKVRRRVATATFWIVFVIVAAFIWFKV